MKSLIEYKKVLTNKTSKICYASVALFFMPGIAHAADVGSSGLIGVFKNLIEVMQVGAQAVIAGSFVLGLGFAALAFFLFKGAGEPNGQNKGVWFAIILSAVAAGGLMYLGASAYLFGDTLFNADGSAGSIDKTKYGL